MSLPREILDQLLTGYLDDALSTDERARVEQLVRDDADVARELQELRELSGSLRAIKQSDRQFKLEEGFADRVLDHAIARATAEGLGEEHPLVQLAAQPTAGTDPKQATSWRVVGAVLALAASLAIAFVAFRGGPDPVDPDLVAQVPPEDPNESPEKPILPIDDPGETRIADVDPAADPEVGPEMVATTDVPDGTDIKVPAIDDVPGPGPDAVVDIAADPMPKGPDPATDRVLPDDTQYADIPAIMVIDVHRTEAGRKSSAVRAAMRLATIDPEHEKQIAADVVASLKKPNADSEDDPVTVMYLEAPAKNLDRLYLNLVSDSEGIASIGMTLAMDPPLVSAIDKMQPFDPTKIKHSIGWQLQSDSPQVIDTLARSLGDQVFFPLKKETPRPMQGDGADVIGRLMVLVH